ncbi:inner membrane protein Mdm31 [Schizosaccharomyces cryophilus OY26]|uniref:Inner membrane protein Mdm31 n=1 Tax=Schizosaccharomyces cryophilus (strain OY26 / ATCC MYA-4695 / CBS 11777 / NBRC 106824 / NRRL Y48691) TaxID=653667 RepID=S9VZ01_SCHCR|nr:inner membrane protein Mdm31 [Schizosaccharomyces cryophilus OY26]EPY52823.1 inner membrane protein Mdm31 [Schizosaccharomyces cryophilus OY26]
MLIPIVKSSARLVQSHGHWLAPVITYSSTLYGLGVNRNCRQLSTSNATHSVRYVKNDRKFLPTDQALGTIRLQKGCQKLQGCFRLYSTKIPSEQRLPPPSPAASLKPPKKPLLSRAFLKIKNVLFRQNKFLTIDNVTAFFSWWLVSHIVWIILGTTTFFSLLLYTLNTVSAQEYFGKWIGQLMTKNTGFEVVFENAIVPNWRKGLITFNKIQVRRRPEASSKNLHNPSDKPNYEKEFMALRQSYDSTSSVTEDIALLKQGNYTQFDLSIDKADVSFSFARFLNGKGIVKELVLSGVRGVVDRRFVQSDVSIDPRSYRRQHNWGDFEIERFKLEDLRVTLMQPDNFRQFPVSVFFCELPKLRKQWLFYDVMNATNLTGSFDNSMFTVHRLQLKPYSPYMKPYEQSPDMRHSRLRIDNLAIDHLNRGVSGAFGWINDGSVDFSVNISCPQEPAKSIIKRYFHQVLMNAKLTEKKEDPVPDVHFDVDVQLHNPKAAIPIFTNQMGYVNNALLRPIVAYINSTRTFIPIMCHLSKPLSDFDGSWTIYDSGVLQEISSQVSLTLFVSVKTKLFPRSS